MARYELAIRTTITTASVPIATLKAVTNPILVREIHMWYVTQPTTSGGLGIARSTAIANTGLTSVTGFPLNPNSHTATAVAVTAWTNAPTFTAGAFFRRWFAGLPAIGGGNIWVFEPPGLYLVGSAAATSELVIVNLQATAAGTLDMTFVYEED